MNLLILDDEPLFVEQLELIVTLNFPDWTVLKAYTGTEALKLCKEHSIHLALVDIMLSGKNGLEVAEEMRKHHPDLDVIVISAFQDFEYARHSLKLKAMDYLVKPVLESELLNLLTAYVFANPQFNARSESVEHALRIIESRYAEPLKLSTVAEELFMNAQYLSRLFSEEIGIPFSEYLLRYRIKIAEELLIKEPSWTIDHVASVVGFNSQHYFIKVFKKVLHNSPARYRQEKMTK